MKVLNELSVKDLKLNKKRSIVIIIGIILSTALICAVAGLITSFQQTFIETAKNSKGNYHAIFYNVPKEELKYIEENRNVKDYYLSEEIGFAREVKEYKANPEAYQGHVGDVSTVIRVALTSRSNTPDMYEIMQVLEKERIFKRFETAIEKLK